MCLRLSPPWNSEPSGSERRHLSPRPERGEQEPLMALGCVWWPQWTHTLGLSHRQNNDFFLKTSPVNSVCRVGSCKFLGFIWDLLSFLCQQLSPSTQAGRGLFPERPAGWPRGLFHTSLSRSVCSMLPQSCLQLTRTPHQLPRGWGHRGGKAGPSHTQRHPYCSCSLSWGHGGGSNRPVSGDSGARVCVHELGEQARRK